MPCYASKRKIARMPFKRAMKISKTEYPALSKKRQQKVAAKIAYGGKSKKRLD